MRRGTRLTTVALAAVLVATLLPIGRSTVDAATVLVVTSTADAPDASPGDGTCATAGAVCTVRAAVEEANVLGGSVEVTVPAGTYMVASNIPITGDVTISGASSAATEFRPTARVSGFVAIFHLAANASITVLDAAYTDPTETSVAFVHLAGDDTSARLEDVSVSDAKWTAAYVENGVDRASVEVVRSTITDVEYPIFFDEGRDQVLDIRESSIVRGGYSGLFVATLSGAFTITDSEIIDSQGNGIEFSTNTAAGDGTSTLEIVRSRISGSTGTRQGVRVSTSRLAGQTTHTTRIVDSVIADNTGIGAWVEGNLVIEDSTFSGNGSVSGNAAVDHSLGSVSVTGSTFSGNGYGLALFGPFDADPASTVTIRDSTITDNTSGEWAGIDVEAGFGSRQRYAAITISNLTITGNPYGLYAGQALTMTNTLIDGVESDCYSVPPISGGHNADTDGTCGLDDPGDLTGIDPLLGPLADNGGSTLTHLPATDSPLIDGGSNADCTAADQRGTGRPLDGDGDGTATCDIGAVEVGSGTEPGDLDIRWTGDATRRGLLRADGGLEVTIEGTPGGTGRAELAIRSWYADGIPGGALLPEPTDATVGIPLAEVSAGRYVGTLPLDGVERVLSISGEVDYGASTVNETTTERLPVLVAGAIEIVTALDVPAWALPTPRVDATSTLVLDGDSLIVPISGTTTTRWLRPAVDYGVTLRDGQNRLLHEVAQPTVVRGGLVTQLTLATKPLPYVPFAVRFVDANDDPVDGLRVTLTNVETGEQLAKAVTQADGSVTGVARGIAVRAAMDPQDQPYAAIDQEIALTALDQTKVIELDETLPTARVMGAVLHPDRPPVAGARVSFSSKVGERIFTTSTIAGSGGVYEAVVFQGEVTVTVDEPLAGRAQVVRQIDTDTTIDLTLDGPAIGTLDIVFRTRLAGEDDWTPIPITGANTWHYGLSVSDPAGKNWFQPFSNTVQTPVRVGVPVRFCADGQEAELPAACVDAPVDPGTLHAVAALDLEQYARVKGRLVAEAPVFADPSDYQGSIRATVLRRAPDGTVTSRQVPVRFDDEPVSGQPLHATFGIGIFEAGSYDVLFEISHIVRGGSGFFEFRGSHTSQIRLDVADPGVIDLGDVPLQLCNLDQARAGLCISTLSLSPDTVTTISPTSIVPGGIARIRTSAHNIFLGGPLEDTVISLRVPAGSSLVSGSVLLDGQAVPYTLSDRVIAVDAGTMPDDSVKVLQAWVRVDLNAQVDALWTEGRITFAPDRRPYSLGTGTAAVSRLILEVPAQTDSLEVPVSGRAAPGAVVEVAVDGVNRSTAVTPSGGSWKTTLKLPEVPLARTFAVQASTPGPGGTIRSPVEFVRYDPAAPVLETIVLVDGSDNRIVIKPENGVRAFPFVWTWRPVPFELYFDHPGRVKELTVALGSATEVATWDPTANAFKAQITASSSQVGKLVVSWNQTAATYDLAPPTQPPPLTDGELRALLPLPLNTYTAYQQIAPDPGEAIAFTATLPDMDDAELRVGLRLTRGLYEPSADDLARAEASGVAMWDYRWSVAPGLDGVDVATITAFIPDSSLNLTADSGGPGIVFASSAGRTAVGPTAAGVVQGTTAAFTLTMKHFETPFNWFSTLKDEYGALNAHQFLVKLNGLLTRVDDTCSDPLVALGLRLRLDRLAQDYLAQQALTATMMMIGLLAAPETFGLGTLALWGLSEAIGAIASAVLDSKYDEVEREIAAVCVDWQRPAAVRECDRFIWFDACDVFADPTYIYDPSGYTYEVFEDTRLKGVTATVETAPDPGGPWAIWDADWFGQENPQLTDQEGRYGWDVPEGWWRVRFGKAGYETAYSDALEVLPPHFDVNVRMTSLQPPAIRSATGVVGDTALVVFFESWMGATWLDLATISLADDEGIPVAFTPATADARASADYGDVARTLRLDVGRPLVAGESFTVSIDKSVRTYAGIPADADLVAEASVVASVNDAPVAADDSAATSEDTPLVGASVLANDSDLHDGAPGENNLPLTATLVAGPSHAASFTLNPNGTFDYTPVADYNGPDSFTYRSIDDLGRAGNTATVSILVASVVDDECDGRAGVLFDANLIDGPTEVRRGGTHRWVVEMRVLACERVVNVSAQGGTPAWSTTTAVSEDGTVTSRLNRRQQVLMWQIGSMGVGGEATLRLTVDGTIAAKASCGGTVVVSGSWSVTATPDRPGGVATKFATVDPIGAVVICEGAGSFVAMSDPVQRGSVTL